MATIADNLQAVKMRIAHAARAAQREPSTVTLLAVSKTQPIRRVQEAHIAGQNAFGENYVQDALAKIEALPGAEWHLIGSLQSNKTRVAAERFDWVQTVDREKIASRLSAQRPAGRPALNVLIQVNVSGESTKSGVAMGDAARLAEAVAAMPRLRLRGLMAIPAAGAKEDLLNMQALFEELRPRFGFDTLSLGMSYDLESAIAHGSTMVRIGTAIFGARRAERTAA